MKKKLFALAITLLLISIAAFTAVNADAPAQKGISAPGGNVTNIEELKTALGGDDCVTVGKDEYTIYLSNDIFLEAPVYINSGNYRIIGRGSVIYRGFSNGALFYLSATSLTDKDGNTIALPTLTLGADISVDAQDLENPDLTLNGNKEAFSEAVNGPLLAIFGKGEITVNPGTKLTNNYSCAPGGAIYLESFSQGDETTPLDPTLTVNGGEISGNISTISGGAIAALGETAAGLIQINGCKITGNTVTEDKTYLEKGCGGAIYVDSFRLVLTTCEISSNVADLGGAIYSNYETLITNCSITKNRALISGGAIYGDAKTNGYDQKIYHAKINLQSVYITENHSEGTGGAITNNGELTFSADNASYVSKNTSVGDGAIAYNTGTLNMDSSEFFYNSSSNGRGGVYNTGVLVYNGADTRMNTTQIGSAIYNIGELIFKKGCLTKNTCIVENAPQIANLGKMSMFGSFVIENDVIGLFPTASENAVNGYTYIEMTNTITTNVQFAVTFFESIPESGDIKALELAPKNGYTVFTGLKRHTESAVSRVVILDDGIGKYELNANGSISYKFPVMPIGAWIGCILGVTAISCGTVFYVRKKKTSASEKNETKK